MFTITPTARHRRSPYYEATVAAGVTGFSTYNKMLLPSGYGDPEGEYWRLIKGVQQWDVAAQRQVQLTGPDAARLAQILAPRDLSKCVEGRGKYVALCDHNGTLLNDPVLLKLADDRFWFSIADSDMLYWARAIAAERGLSVTVDEPDVSPLAVQGPLAEDVIASIFGDWIRDLKLFWFRETEIGGIPVILARSGWSKQGGFELYLMDGSKGMALWNIVREAGRSWDIGPGSPNHIERIESGLLSWGGDTDDRTNPFEVRMERYVDLDLPDSVIGAKALRQISASGPARWQLGVILEGEKPYETNGVWAEISANGVFVGHMTNLTWSRRMGHNIGFALISRQCASGDVLEIALPSGLVSGTLTELPFL